MIGTIRTPNQHHTVVFICCNLMIICFSGCVIAGDKQTNAANELFIAIPKNSFVNERIYLLVTTHDSGYTHFSVASSSFFYVGGVSNGTFSIIELPETLELQDENDRSKGIRIRSTDRNKKISAYVLKEGQFLSGGYLALPSKPFTGVTQYVYYVTSYLWDNRVNINPYSGVVVVGCYSNTQITITPSQSISIPSDLQPLNTSWSSVLPGQAFIVTLNAFQTYDFDSALDLTGTKIVANKPISVFGYHECADIPMGVGFCDYLVEQFPPTITWGRFFHLSSLNSRNSSVKYRMIGMSSSTSTKILCTVQGQILPEVTTQSYFLSESGEAYEFEIRQNRFCSLQANKPILVVQYSPGYSIDRTGDPFMLNIPPVEQYSNNYTLRADPSFSNHMTITVGVPYFNPERIFVDQDTIASSRWTPIYCSSSVVCGYGTMFSITSGTHYVYHSEPRTKIGAQLYGFEYHTAYGYPGGMELNRITGVCEHGDVQLVPLPGSVSMAGRVEICLDGVWSNICGRTWTNRDAGVVCRQLGYSSQGAVAYSGLSHNKVAWPFIVSATNCNGSEAQLLNCVYSAHFAECGQAEAAFAHCQLVSNLTAVTAVISDVRERSPAIISCTVVVISTVSDEHTVNITWSKDDHQLHSNSEISIVSANLTKHTYQSNLTIHVLEASDIGLYSCLATTTLSESSNQLASSVMSSIYLDMEASSSLIFQLRLIGVGHCSVWLLQFSKPAEKIMKVINTIVENTLELCEDCGLTRNHITDGAFQCFTQNAHEVTFRARLHVSPSSSLMELINYIVDWIENGASVAIDGILLSIDQRCDIVLESFSDPECHHEHQTTTLTYEMPTTTSPGGSTTVETTAPFTRVTAIPAAFISNITTYTVSPVHLRSPATLSCVVLFTATITNVTTVTITWSKDGRQLYSNRELIITSSNESGISFKSNLTIYVVEISDSGFYSCQVVLLSTLTHNPISQPTTSTLHIEIEASLSLLFQLRLIGVGYCSQWLLHYSTVTERMTKVINTIVDNTHALCENCGLTANHITDGAFQCFRQGAHEVTFRAHLYATPTSTPQELVNYIINWVRHGVSVVINGLLLTIDRSCDVIIESFSVPECTQEQQQETTGPAETTTTKDMTTTTTNHIFKSITIPKHDTTRPISQQPTMVTNTLHFSAEVIVVGAVVVMVIFIVAVMLTVIIVVCLCTKYCSVCQSGQATNQAAPSSTVTSVPLPSYSVFQADLKMEASEMKEPPPDYSAASHTVHMAADDAPSYYRDSTTVL